MYVRTACERAGGTAHDAKRMWRPSCLLLKHGGGTLDIIRSPVCNYNNHEKLYLVFNIDLLSASHNLMYFSLFLPEQARRAAEAARGAKRLVYSYE